MVEPPGGGFALEKQISTTYRFDSVAHWLSAFHVFVGIYCEKYPHDIGSLMKYADTIQNLARRSCDIAAFMYDKTFRQWRETARVYYHGTRLIHSFTMMLCILGYKLNKSEW